jgi:hypothetical protein
MKYDRQLVALFIFLNTIFLLRQPTKATDFSQTENVHISAAIEDSRVVLFGFTSPNSKVELSNPKIYATTYSKDNGYFEFDRLILPKNPGELCLLALDDSLRQTSPVCIPPPPPVNYLTNIGPVILPPTISIDSDNVLVDSTTAASGQSIPLSIINVYIYQSVPQPMLAPKPVQAFGLPVFSTTTDKDGNYSLSIPSIYSSSYRLFSTVNFVSLPSPKSNTIFYQLPQSFNLLFIIPIFIVSLLLFIYLVILYFQKNRHHYLPAIYSYPLMIVND